MVERQQIHQRSEAQPFRPLRQRGHEQAGRRRQSQRRAVVLGQMVGMKAEAVVRLGKLHASLELLAERHAAVVHMVEHTKLHGCSPACSSVPAANRQWHRWLARDACKNLAWHCSFAGAAALILALAIPPGQCLRGYANYWREDRLGASANNRTTSLPSRALSRPSGVSLPSDVPATKP